LAVSQLGMGGLFVNSNLAEFAQARDAIRRAVDLGVNYIDTAPGYGDSERVVGAALEGVEAPTVLSTKLGGRPQPFDPRDKGALRRSVEESLRLLKRDHVDILMVHEPDRPGQYDWWTDWQDINGPVLELLDELKAEGVIRHTGLAGTTAYELAHLVRNGTFDVVLTAFNYSLLWREAGLEVIPAARGRQVGVIVGSPLQQGALARKYDGAVSDTTYWLAAARREQFRTLYAFADECGASLPELSLRWVISNPDVHCVLMGARSSREVEQNVAAVEKGPLPADVLQRLDEIHAMVPYRPFEEPFSIGWRLGQPAGYKGPGPA
jgi:aryl-alcohol dehydrogenase-like predicted oxidoreductase